MEQFSEWFDQAGVHSHSHSHVSFRDEDSTPSSVISTKRVELGDDACDNLIMKLLVKGKTELSDKMILFIT